MCGEYLKLILEPQTGRGSPPRVRGIHDADWSTVRDFRITPACAGNTFFESAIGGFYKDHPRVCGEYVGRAGSHNSSKGSPPRVRGILVDTIEDLDMTRITPACAGNTRPLLQR